MFLEDEARYRNWRRAKLDQHPRCVEQVFVDIGGLHHLTDTQKAAITSICKCSNMAIYRCDDAFVDRAAILAFGAKFGLQRLDFHMCANPDGVSELTVASGGARAAYVPYSNHSLSWHTDGYYNAQSGQVRAVILHCASQAAEGGENALLDPEIAYIRMRDENPDYIRAFEHPECMTIPANTGRQGEIRPAACGPVFRWDADTGALHMRYSARKKNIQWRDDKLTRCARDFLSEFLADKNGPVLHYRLKAGEGLISNNVLHNRTAFKNAGTQGRLLYRARFFDRIGQATEVL